MGTVVQFKRSTSQGSKPSTSQLSSGELAINTNDGKIFMEKDNGTIAEIALGVNELILDDSVISSASLTTSATTANQIVDSVINLVRTRSAGYFDLSANNFKVYTCEIDKVRYLEDVDVDKTYYKAIITIENRVQKTT